MSLKHNRYLLRNINSKCISSSHYSKRCISNVPLSHLTSLTCSSYLALTQSNNSKTLLSSPKCVFRSSSLKYVRYFSTRILKVPSMGDSISEGTIVELLKENNSTFDVDEIISRIETDKVSIDIRADCSGVVKQWKVETGQTVNVGADLVEIQETTGKSEQSTKTTDTSSANEKSSKTSETTSEAPKSSSSIGTSYGKIGSTTPAPTSTNLSPSQHSTQSSVSSEHHFAHSPSIQFRYGKRDENGNIIGGIISSTNLSSYGNNSSTSSIPQQTNSKSASKTSSTPQTYQPNDFFSIPSKDFTKQNNDWYAAINELPNKYKTKYKYNDKQIELLNLGGATPYELKPKKGAKK